MPKTYIVSMTHMPALKPITEIPMHSRVILRMDMDVPMHDGKVSDEDRLKKSIPTITSLIEKECTIFLLGHLGRPKGKDPTYSLRPVFQCVLNLLGKPVGQEDVFIDDIEDKDALQKASEKHRLIFLENVRFWQGEEQNDNAFLQPLISCADWFVNDALAVSHRKHRSIMLHHELPTAYGIAFIEEVGKLMHVVDNPEHPMTVILGGAKKDKLSYVAPLMPIVDHMLLGGKLPHLLSPEVPITDKLVVAALQDTGCDINDHDIAVFTSIINVSRTIIWAGAMGVFEDARYRKGTEEIAKAIVKSGAYTVVAGGDTEASISNIGEEEKISVIASGGGMMLELLTKKSLPAWE